MSNRAGIAAAIGGWSVRHRLAAIVGWLAFVAVTMAVGSMSGQQHMTEDQYAAGDSAKAIQILDEAGLSTPAGEMVLVTSQGPVTDPAPRAAVADLVARLQATPAVIGVVDPYANELVSADGHSVLVRVSMSGDPMTAADRVPPILDTVAATRTAHPELRIDEFGDGSANKWFNDTIGKDFTRAEWTAVPLALGILLVAFGALLAAVLPVGLALTSFLAANGILGLVSHWMSLDTSTSSVMLLVGLAVGVDYCMFYLRRVREERVRGRDPATALQIAAATSGRSVLVSGLTVVVAMSGMFMSGMLIFEGFAVAAILVVLVAVLGSVTVLPAVLALLGDRVELGRVPGLGRMRRPGEGSRAWGAILGPVLKRPGLSALLAGGALLVLAAPATGIHTENLSLDKLLPADASIMQSYHRITAAFPGGPAPARVVVKAPDAQSTEMTAAVEQFRSQALASGLVQEPIVVDVDPASNVVQISVPLAGNGSDDTSMRALHELRSDIVPATLGSVPGAEAYVGGNLAFSEDFNTQLQHAIVPVILFVLVLAFLLMLVAFRSIAIAVVSVLLNVLSMAATFGVMVAVFQHGWGASLVGGGDVGAIQSWIPLFAFVILFGLSMDYHVFVVSRIQEAHERGMPTRDAVAHGIRISAGVVTSAAVIMVAVFSVFATLSMTTMKQLGVGLAVAILLDATLVRAVLLPSVLAFLGDRIWWLPRWLSFLPQHPRSEPVAPTAAATGRPRTGPWPGSDDPARSALARSPAHLALGDRVLVRARVVGPEVVQPHGGEPDSGHAGEAAAGDSAADRPQVGGDPGADLAAERADRVRQHLDARQPAPHRLGDGLAPDRAAEDAGDHVRGTGECEEDADQPDRRHHAGQRHHGAVRRRGDHDRPAVVVHPGGPAAQGGRQQGADGLGRVEQAEQLGSLEDLLDQRREQHHRDRQQHRGDVDQVGAEQVPALERVGQPLADAGQRRRRRLVAVRVARHPPEHQGRHRQPADVDEEAPADPDVGHQQSADRGADQDAELHAQAGECVGGRELVVGHGARHECLAAGPLHRGRRRESRRDHEDEPHVRLVPEGVHCQDPCERRLGDTGPHQQLASVDVVGQRAAVQPEHDQRRQLCQPDGTDREVRAGQRVDLVGDRHIADHRAEIEDRAGVEQEPEVERGAERGDVHPERAQPIDPGHEQEQWHGAPLPARRRPRRPRERDLARDQAGEPAPGDGCLVDGRKRLVRADPVLEAGW
jgi:uncharacterized membrane protein YdfJ with MMPL/SSD domain